MPYRIKLLLAKSEELQERSTRIREQIKIQDEHRERLFKSSAKLLLVTRRTITPSVSGAQDLQHDRNSI